MSLLALLFLAFLVGSASGVVSSLLSAEAIRKAERQKFIRETLADVKRNE